MKYLIICLILPLFLLSCNSDYSDTNKEELTEPNSMLVPLVSHYMESGHIDFIPYERITNLSKSTDSKEQFMVPEGTINIALNKNVTSSSDTIYMGKLDMVTDGIMTSRHENHSLLYDVELAPGVQYITIDLNGLYNIYAIRFWHCYPMNPVYFDIIVQISEDPDFKKDVHILFNNDHDNSAGLGAGTDKNYIEYSGGKVVDGKGIKSRYVRLYSNGNWGNEFNHYTEVEVFGKPVKD